MCLDYEWDEEKNAANKRKHGIGFEEINKFNWNLAVGTETQYVDGEYRDVWIGPLPSGLIASIVTERKEVTRVISLRKATNHEKQKWTDEFR